MTFGAVLREEIAGEDVDKPDADDEASIGEHSATVDVTVRGKDTVK